MMMRKKWQQVFNLNWYHQLKRWQVARVILHQDLDRLQKENDDLRAKLAALRHAKEQAEKQLEERRREKEVLRARLVDQKKAVDTVELVSAQVSAKYQELQKEFERLRRSKKSR